MNHRITIAGIGRAFDVSPDESILDAALANGIRIRYGCRRGKCSMCKHYIVRGEVDDSQVSPYAISDEERDNDLAVLCLTFARTDCEIELIEAESDDGGVEVPLPQPFVGTVESVEPISTGMVLLRLRIRDAPTLLAGQYLELAVPSDSSKTRSYSIAGRPSADHVEIIVKRIPGGLFSGTVDSLEGCELSLRGPFGDMFLRPGERPILLVGAGSGIGPLRSILQELVAQSSSRRVRLFYGARTSDDVPAPNELQEFAKLLPGFSLELTLSQPESAWSGSAGRVTRVLAAQFGTDPDLDAYVCGPPEMCDDVRFILEARGVPETQIHCDAFYAAD